jgi:hypothetical protein
MSYTTIDANDKRRKLGPNAKKLLIRFMAREAIPPGGDVADGARFFLNDEHRKSVMDRAWTNFNAAIAAVKATHNNPHGDDEEAIAGAILVLIAEKEQSR